jgi:S-DNA-T family DNA segregation ATPase FtsK/SpoIIIE
MELRVRVVAPGRSGVVAAGTSRLTDVVLDVPPGTTFGSVADELRTAAGGVGELFIEGRAVPHATRVGEPPLVHGAVITVGHPGTTPRQHGAVRLRVETGPDAGALHWLEPGGHYVGRAVGADICVDDPDISRNHACIELGWDGATVRDLQSTNGTFVDGSPVGSEPVDLPFGAQLRVGSSILTLGAPQDLPAPLRPDDKGRLEFNRPPRIQPATAPVEVQLPPPPERRERLRFPAIAIVLPVIVAVAMATLLSQPTFLLFGLLSPVMFMAQWVADRTGSAKSTKRAQDEYAVRLADAEERIRRAVTEEARTLRASCPDAAEVASMVRNPTTRLWERRPSDGDFLRIRLGTGSLPASVQIRTPGGPHDSPRSPRLEDAPIAVDLRQVGVLGITGHPDRALGVARFVVGQLAALHSPRHLRLAFLTTEEEETVTPVWDWIGWLPHVVAHGQAECRALLGLTEGQLAARISELLGRLRPREASAPACETVQTVVLLHGARRLRTYPGVARLLSEGPASGIYVICLEQDPVALPAECGARALIPPDHSTVMRVDVAGCAAITDAAPDAVSARWVQRLAHGLAPLRDATPRHNFHALPGAVRWLDLYTSRSNAPAPAAADIAKKWCRGGRSPRALLGAASYGAFIVDLSRDGPHMLVAGTTGSGKSELLQTLVCSLAVENPPDAVSFVLIDYKGGAAFADCARLPHTVAMLTDLDERLTQRALTSLKAELRRREQLFAEAGVTDINQYQSRGVDRWPLARLVIVVDEFATLVEELPEFIRGLVAVAMRGRSLGVHLVLATQRPAGAVSADIRANVGLSIALRVTDVADSVDVIGAKDAAAIDRRTPGRAFVRRGAEPIIAFQIALITGHATANEAPSVTVMPFAKLGDPPARKQPRRDALACDLTLIVDAIRTATSDLALPGATSPWLPPLPSQLTLDDLARSACAPHAHWLPYGLLDAPAEQRQQVVGLDLAAGRHLLFAGTSRSGRSTLLRTIAAGAVSCGADVHIYGIDCGNGALLALRDLPLCGAIATADQADRVSRLLDRLQREVHHRCNLFATAGFTDVTEQRSSAAPADQMPYLLLLLDAWEGFLATLDDVDAGRLTNAVLALLREGKAAGLRVVVTADRSGLVGRIASLIDDKIILRLDRADVALAGLSPDCVSSDLPPGRGFQAGTGFEVQLALPSNDSSGPGQLAALRHLAAASAASASSSAAQRPFRIEELPGVVPYDAVARPSGANPLWIVVGIGGDQCVPYGIDLAEDGPCFVVTGPPRSGRSTALQAMTMSLVQGGSRVVAVTPRPSPLRRLIGTPGVLGVPVDDPGTFTALTNVDGPIAVVVDDAELVTDSPVGALLESYIKTARDRGRALVVAATTSELMHQFRGFAAEARKCRSGLLLAPESALDGDVLGARLPRSSVGHGPRGRGVLVVRGRLTPVQVPFVTLP